MRPSPLRVTTGILVVLLGLSVASASAQHLFYTTVNLPNGSHALARATVSPSSLGAFESLVVMPGFAGASAVVTTAGRFAAWDNNAGQVTVLDTRTGTLIPLSVNTGATGGRIFAHPQEVRLFVVPSGPNESMAIIDATGIRSVPIGEVIGSPASNGRHLFVLRTVPGTSGPSSLYRITAIDMQTGAELYQLPTDFTPRIPVLAVSDDGQRLAVGHYDLAERRFIRVFDTVSRTEVASRQMPLVGTAPNYTPLAFDEQRNRLFVSHQYSPGIVLSDQTGQLLVLDATTLADLGAGTPRGGAPLFALSRRDEVGVNAPSTHSRFGGCGMGTLETWGANNAPSSTQSPPSISVCPRGVAIASPPDPMSTVTRQVVGRRVTLSWPAAIGANDYVVEAGSASGLSNLAQVRTGGTLQLVAENVPPGTYFVRVRAVNDVGASSPSPEITVVVS